MDRLEDDKEKGSNNDTRKAKLCKAQHHHQTGDVWMRVGDHLVEESIQVAQSDLRHQNRDRVQEGRGIALQEGHEEGRDEDQIRGEEGEECDGAENNSSGDAKALHCVGRVELMATNMFSRTKEGAKERKTYRSHHEEEKPSDESVRDAEEKAAEKDLTDVTSDRV